MQCEKLIRVVNRRIFDLKELKKMEAEEAAKSLNVEEQIVYVVKQGLADLEGLRLSSLLGPNDQPFPFDFALSFNLLTDLGIFKNVEISFDIRLSS